MNANASTVRDAFAAAIARAATVLHHKVRGAPGLVEASAAPLRREHADGGATRAQFAERDAGAGLEPFDEVPTHRGADLRERHHLGGQHR